MPPPAPFFTKTLPPFNKGMPLRVVRSKEGWMGVVDERAEKIWVEEEWGSSVSLEDEEGLIEVVVPSIPSNYGKWVYKPIGGVSSTARRVGCVRSDPRKGGSPAIVFATNSPSPTSVHTSLSSVPHLCTVGDGEEDPEFGYTAEIVVHDSKDLETVCARVARYGATPILEDSSLNTRRKLGVERLDRIGSNVSEEEEKEEGLHGPRRGVENWRFDWLPKDWKKAPITWDHMVSNSEGVEVNKLSQPLRQHVAKKMLVEGTFPHVGMEWKEAECPPTQKEVKLKGERDPPYPLRKIVSYPLLALLIGCGVRKFSEKDLFENGVEDEIPSRCLLKGEDGVWYRPVDPSSYIKSQIPVKRYVSPALEQKQTEQLISAFFYLSVEKGEDKEERKACSLVLLQYMKERGYTARWLGKYDQEALYVGNGSSFRPFKRLSQYDPGRLPTEVLNRICKNDGSLKNKGSKGSRSKYKTKGKYVPRRLLKRSREEEEGMMGRENGKS